MSQNPFWSKVRPIKKTLLMAGSVTAICYVSDLWSFAPGEHLSYLAYYTFIGALILVFVSLVQIVGHHFISSPQRPWIQFLMDSIGIAAALVFALKFGGILLHKDLNFLEVWSFLVPSVVISLVFTFYFEQREIREELLEMRVTSAEARYGALEKQIQPHFLFNAFNSLTELIASDHEKSMEMSQLLADLYREILNRSESKTSTLGSEISLATKYLEIEKLRFPTRLTYEFSIPKNADEIFIPSLLVQTLVENAVKHGIAKSIQGGIINLNVQQNDSHGYAFRLVNSGAPLPEKLIHNTGLKNTLSRLNLFYGDTHDFSLTSDDSQRTVLHFHFSGAQIV